MSAKVSQLWICKYFLGHQPMLPYKWSLAVLSHMRLGGIYPLSFHKNAVAANIQPCWKCVILFNPCDRSCNSCVMNARKTNWWNKLTEQFHKNIIFSCSVLVNMCSDPLTFSSVLKAGSICLIVSRTGRDRWKMIATAMLIQYNRVITHSELY